MDNLKRIQQITRHYPELQGLRMLPLGLFLLANGLQRQEVFPWLGRQGDLAYPLLLLIIVIGLWFWLGRYYERTFGKVEPLPKSTRTTFWIIAFPIGLVGLIILEIVLYRIKIALPVSLMGLWMGAGILYSGLVSRRWYYSGAGVILLIASFLPWMMGVDISDRLYGSMGIVYTILLAIIIILTGVLDHIRLVRTFSAAQGVAYGRDA